MNRLLLICIGLFTLIGWSQTPADDLKNNQWFVYKIVVDEVEMIQPSTSSIIFTEPNLEYFINQNSFAVRYCGEICGSGGAVFSDLVTDESFIFNKEVCYGIFECSYPTSEVFNFKSIYFDFYNSFSPNSYLCSYTITTLESGVQELVVTNPIGDQAYYYSSPTASVSQFEQDQVQIYPNPVEEFLTVDLSLLNENALELVVYDSTGKLIMSSSVLGGEISQLNLKALTSGHYMLGIKKYGKLEYNQWIVKK